MSEETSFEHEDDIQLETTKKRWMDFKVRIHSLLTVKFVKLSEFQAPTFDFPDLLKFQKIDKFVYDNGPVYPDLVKAFMHNLSINMNEHDKNILRTVVRNCEIVEDLNGIAASLKIPYSRFFLRKGVNFNDGPWA